MKALLIPALLTLIAVVGLTTSLSQMEFNTAVAFAYVGFAILTIYASRLTDTRLKKIVADAGCVVLIATYFALGLPSTFGAIFTGFIFLVVFNAFTWR